MGCLPRMGVDIDESWHQCHAIAIHYESILRNLDVFWIAHMKDSIPLHHHSTGFNYPVPLHGDDSSSIQYNDPFRHIRFEVQIHSGNRLS